MIKNNIYKKRNNLSLLQSCHPSSVNDFKVFQDLIKHMTETLKIFLEVVQEKYDKPLEILHSSIAGRITMLTK